MYLLRIPQGLLPLYTATEVATVILKKMYGSRWLFLPDCYVSFLVGAGQKRGVCRTFPAFYGGF